MSIRVNKINKERIKPLPIVKVDPEKIKGCQIFPTLDGQCYLVARKNSGKTTVIAHIIKRCIDKRTKVFVFGGTVYKDAAWDEILKYMDKKKIAHEEFTSLYENGPNELDIIIKDMQIAPKVKDEKTPIPSQPMKPLKYITADSDDEDEKPPRISKPKKFVPENLFIFDDLSDELKDTALRAFTKKNRHFKAKVLISNQSYYDLEKKARAQMDYFMLFHEIPEDVLGSIYKEMGITKIPFGVFLDLYRDATAENYGFLYIDRAKQLFRKNLNYEYELGEVE